VLDKGRKNVEILKQGQYQPVPIEKQIAIIYCGVKGLLSAVPVNKIKDFETEFIERIEVKHKDVLQELKSGNISDNVDKTIRQVVKDLTAQYE
jgi:F-type H+/Na+-transporting ATPase subunit alpha